MKQLEYWGDFWLGSSPERRVPGHLTFHPKRGGRLLLHTSLHPDDPTGGNRRRYERLMGKVLGRSCVLLECFDSGSAMSEPEPGQWEVNARIFVNGLLLLPRRHSEAPAEQFMAASASFHGLAEFDGRQAFEFDHPDDGDTVSERVTARALETRTVETDQATIEFLHGTGSKSRDFKSQSLVSHHSLRVTPRAPMPLEDLIDRYSRVRTLVALALHQDCQFRSPIYLQPAPMPGGKDHDDDPYMRPYEYHAVWLRGRRHSYEFYNRVLSFESLGPEGIARWLALEGDCGHVISRLSSMRYTRRLAYQDALLRVVAAADSLHRVVAGRERTPLETVLKDLAEYAGYPFRDAVPDVGAWGKAVIDERHNAAHNKGRPILEPTLTTQLVESVYFLVLICLLRRSEAPDSAFESVRRSQPFVWPMREIFAKFGGEEWLAVGKPR